jgi:hypothetical protein
MLTSRQRILRAIEHKAANRIPIVEIPWDATLKRWEKEGLPNGRPWCQFFDVGKVAEIDIDVSPHYPKVTVEEYNHGVSVLYAVGGIANIGVAMGFYQGRLFCRYVAPGHIYAMEAGKNATHDYELGYGWKKICAVKGRNCLSIYVDGRLIANSTEYHSGEYDLSNDELLRIGLGEHDFFNGRMKNLRIFNRALSENEISEL